MYFIKQVATRVEIGSWYTFVYDTVNSTVLSQQNAYAFVGHDRARYDQTNAIDLQDCIRKTDLPINLYSYPRLVPVGIMYGMRKIIPEFAREQIFRDHRSMGSRVPNQLNSIKFILIII